MDTKEVHNKEKAKSFLKFNKLFINKISIIKYKKRNLSNRIDLKIFSWPTVEKLIIEETIIKIKNIVKNNFALFIWKTSPFCLTNIIPAIRNKRTFKFTIKLPAIKEIGNRDKRKLVKFSKFSNFFNWNIFY